MGKLRDEGRKVGNGCSRKKNEAGMVRVQVEILLTVGVDTAFVVALCHELPASEVLLSRSEVEVVVVSVRGS